MASEFIGLAVSITLKDTGCTRLHGTIVNIINRDLVLANVTFLNNGYQIPTYTVQGPLIENLDVVPADYPLQEVENIPPPVPQISSASNSVYLSTSHPEPHLQPPAPSSAATSTQFIDPAILSFTRAPAPRVPSSQTTSAPPPYAAPKSTYHVTDEPVSLRTHPSVPALRQTPPSKAFSGSSQKQHITQNQTTATSAELISKSGTPKDLPQLQAPFQELSLGREAAESSAPEETDDALAALPTKYPPYTGKRSKRGGKGRHDKKHDSGAGSGSSRNAAAPQIPPSPKSGFTPPRHPSWRNHRKFSKSAHFNGDEDGWATEDVNDIKETEFDFQGNLDRFDKKTVFSQLKAEDTTADEARLVSHNRLPQRSGSKEKPPVRKNYKNTENVLSTYTNGQPLSDRDTWNRTPLLGADYSSESSVRGRNDGANSGRSSRRALSRSVPRRPSTKQGSVPIASLMAQGASSSGGGGGPSIATQDPRVKGSIRISCSHRPGQGISPLDMERNKVCPIVSPLQMLDVERIAETEMGLEDILMTENAARGIASVAIQAFGTRLTSSNHNPLPVVLVFAGNNKSGARVIAAGRHLKNHHVRVMVCMVGLDREDELLEFVRRQLTMFRNAGGRVARLEELVSNLKTIDSPPELIIDGILGIHMSFEDLRTDDQATAFELINFANKSTALVLSVDIPSGIDGQTGQIAQLEDTGSVHMRAKWVVALGAPKTGLLAALDSGVGSGWKLFVADIGLPSAAWRKYGSRRRHGVEFGADWVVPLEHVPGH